MRRSLTNLLTVLAFVVPAALGADPAPPDNPLFGELRKEGVAVGGGEKIKLPPPTMADGLDARGQQAVLARVAERQGCSVEDLLANTAVAPHLFESHEVEAKDPKLPVYAVDVFFVAHGSLDVLTRRNFLEGWQTTRKDRKVHVLTREELAARKLEARSAAGLDERYNHFAADVLERVRVAATLQTVVTRGADSVLSGTRLDPRFVDDPQFPDTWRPLKPDDEGRLQAGEPHPYTGAAAYVKATRLAEPEGGLFVEYHAVYTEPKAWFSGANPLRSKMRAIVQSEVRDFRRALARAK